ncbi:DUF4362 domain-containing protein [Chryseomicrobium excrementi]|nr:DUF4362 domain-containing protein [Chryseomicrobium excrementi]
MRRNYLAVAGMLVFLTGCGEQESANPTLLKVDKQTGEQPVRVVVDYKKVTNRDKFEDFLTGGETKELMIIRNTIEGDPIYRTLKRTDEGIEYTLDTTEDAYGSKEIITSTCQEIVKEREGEFDTYTLTGCDGKEEERYVIELFTDTEE